MEELDNNSDNAVPSSSSSATKDRKKRRVHKSSKSVRVRKSQDRRVYLNRITADNLQKSFKIDVVEVDGRDLDFTDAFAFYTWYLDNFSRLENVSPTMAIKFRNQYMAFNLDEEGRKFIEESVHQKFLFDEAYYDKLVCSDTDESIPDLVHKQQITDGLVPQQHSSQQIGELSPTYRADSPIYCPSTEYDSDISDIDSQLECREKRKQPIPRSPECVTPNDEEMEYEVQKPITEPVPEVPSYKLYTDTGTRHLLRQLTAKDYEDINLIKRSLHKNRTGNAKIRDFEKTVYIKVESIVNFHLVGDSPNLIISADEWRVRRKNIFYEPKVVVHPSLFSHAVNVAIG